MTHQSALDTAVKIAERLGGGLFVCEIAGFCHRRVRMRRFVAESGLGVPLNCLWIVVASRARLKPIFVVPHRRVISSSSNVVIVMRWVSNECLRQKDRRLRSIFFLDVFHS
jgi:hypothetical protein